MGWNDIKLNKQDRWFSNYVREKAHWRCEKCGKLCKIGTEHIFALQASHYFSRSHWNVRYDPENVYALCAGCHRRMGGYTTHGHGEYDIFVKNKLGKIKYNKLLLRAHQKGTKDPKLIDLYLKTLP